MKAWEEIYSKAPDHLKDDIIRIRHICKTQFSITISCSQQQKEWMDIPEEHEKIRLIEAGEREQLKDEIKRSEHRERSYIAHRDTLRQLLNDPSIFIKRIQYENSECLIDYTDSTDIIKAAHFRKDGLIRITDSPEIVALHDARTMKKVKWKTIR